MKHVVYAVVFAVVAFAGVYAFGSESCSVSESEERATKEQLIATDVPKGMEGATITVTTKDGRSSTVPIEKFKVVPRKQQRLVTEVSKSMVRSCVTNDKHRVSALAGRGTKSGLDSDRSGAPDVVTVENRVGGVFGAQYQYKTDYKLLNMPLSIGVQGQTNKTGSVLLGVDF